MFFLVLAFLLLLAGTPLLIHSTNDQSNSYWENGYFTFTIYIRTLDDSQLKASCGSTNYNIGSWSNTGNGYSSNTNSVTNTVHTPDNVGAITSYSTLQNSNSCVQTRAHMGSWTNVYTSTLTYQITVAANDGNYRVSPIYSAGDFYHGTGYYYINTYSTNSTTVSTTQTFSSNGSDVTYDAGVFVLPRKTRLTLNANGGSGGSSAVSTYYGKTWNFANSISEPTREGYNFNGWSTYSGSSSGISSSQLGSYVSYGDATYYATWSRKQYQVDINILSPGGVQDYASGSMTQTYGSRVHTGVNEGFMDILYGDSWTISNITPETGMMLESVYLDNGNGTLRNNGNGTWTFTMDKDSGGNVINIKMRYKNFAIQYLYGYDQNGNGNGNDDVCGTGAVTYASSTNLLAEQERVGYLFNKWHRIGSEEYYDAGASYSPGDFTDGSTIQFEATWNSKEYNVYYNNGYGGADESVGKIYYSNGTYTLRETPSREGYTFTGWLCSADNKVYGGGATYTIPNIDNNSNIKFTALWTENEYIIVYNANNGSGQTLEDRINYTRVYTIIENRFTTVNKFFKGWATEANGAVEYLPGATVSKLTAVNGGRINLYAVWEETWASSAVTAPSGTGSQSDPYIIASAENLAWIASQNDTFNGKFFKQITNIDLDGKVWMPIGTQAEFMGIYDGLSFEIKNVIVPSYLSFGANTYANIGLFGRTNGATISRIHLINTEFNGLNNVGAIVGQVSSMTVVENCILEDCQVYSNNGLGMIIGNNAGTIENCLVLNMRTTNNNLSLGGQSQTSCLYEINIDGALTRYTTDLNSFDYENWGIVGNDLLPCDSSWMASVNIATRASVEAWRDKTL